MGSNPSAATKVGILSELDDIPIRELFVALMDEGIKRKLKLRHLSNDKVFELYDGELILHHRSAKGLCEDRRTLRHFQDSLGQWPPSAELGIKFLSQYAHLKTATLARYTATIKGFFNWYGEKLNVKIPVNRQLPPYVEDADINALLETIRNKATHKKTVARDMFLIHLAVNTGLRRTELSNLKVGDIHLDQGILVVKREKGTIRGS